MKPKKSWAGERPSACGVFLQVSKASRKEASEGHIKMRYFICFTPDSARPFELGLYGDDSSFEMPISLQKELNSERNWGPPSDLRNLGKPKSQNQRNSCLVIVLVVNELSLLTNGKPEKLSINTK